MAAAALAPPRLGHPEPRAQWWPHVSHATVAPAATAAQGAGPGGGWPAAGSSALAPAPPALAPGGAGASRPPPCTSATPPAGQSGNSAA